MCSIITIVITFLMSFITITVVLDFVAAAVVVADVGLLLLLLFPLLLLLLLLLLFLPCFVCPYPHGHCTCQELSTIKVNVPSFYGRHQWCKKVQKFL